jgi:hypothetical protein
MGAGILPIIFLNSKKYQGILERIYFNSFILFIFVLFILIILFKFKNQIVTFLISITIGLGSLLGGALMYVNQYPFLHQALFFYALGFLLLSWHKAFPDGKAFSGIGFSSLRLILGFILFISLPKFLENRPDFIYQSILKTAYVRYHMAPFLELKKNYPYQEKLKYSKINKIFVHQKNITAKPNKINLHHTEIQIQELNKLNKNIIARQGVILIFLDSLRVKSLSHYGYTENETKNFDRFAQSNVTFLNHYTNYCNTHLSLGSIFYSDFIPLRIKISPLSWLRTKQNVNIHSIVSFPLKIKYYPFSTVQYTDEDPEKKLIHAKNYLSAKLETGERFFLVVHLMNTHSPYRSEKGLLSGISSRERYDLAVSWIDKALGEFLNFFYSSKISETAMLIITSDHGEEFREHGGRHHTQSLYNEITHVPLAVSFPFLKNKKYNPSAEISLPTHNLDLLPTIIGFFTNTDTAPYTKLLAYPRQDLRLITSYAKQNKLRLFFPNGRYVFSHSRGHLFLGPIWSITNVNFKYILRYASGVEELYDLKSDYDEQSNLVYLPGNNYISVNLDKFRDVFWNFYFNHYRFEEDRMKGDDEF